MRLVFRTFLSLLVIAIHPASAWADKASSRRGDPPPRDLTAILEKLGPKKDAKSRAQAIGELAKIHVGDVPADALALVRTALADPAVYAYATPPDMYFKPASPLLNAAVPELNDLPGAEKVLALLRGENAAPALLALHRIESGKLPIPAKRADEFKAALGELLEHNPMERDVDIRRARMTLGAMVATGPGTTASYEAAVGALARLDPEMPGDAPSVFTRRLMIELHSLEGGRKVTAEQIARMDDLLRRAPIATPRLSYLVRMSRYDEGRQRLYRFAATLRPGDFPASSYDLELHALWYSIAAHPPTTEAERKLLAEALSDFYGTNALKIVLNRYPKLALQLRPPVEVDHFMILREGPPGQAKRVRALFRDVIQTALTPPSKKANDGIAALNSMLDMEYADDPELVELASKWLGHGLTDGVPATEVFTAERDAGLRLLAAKVVGAAKQPTAEQELRLAAALRDPAETVRTSALDALKKHARARTGLRQETRTIIQAEIDRISALPEAARQGLCPVGELRHALATLRSLSN